jgi:hypothetical protein
VVKLKLSLRKFYGRHHDLSQMTMDMLFVVITVWAFPHSWLVTRFVIRITWWGPHVEQELLTFLEHLSSPWFFSGVCVTRSLVFCVMFCRSLFVLFLFGSCFVCPSIYGFWLPLWYLQTFLRYMSHIRWKMSTRDLICRWRAIHHLPWRMVLTLFWKVCSKFRMMLIDLEGYIELGPKTDNNNNSLQSIWLLWRKFYFLLQKNFFFFFKGTRKQHFFF